MAAPCREALARRASQSTVSCGQPSAGISVEEFLWLRLSLQSESKSLWRDLPLGLISKTPFFLFQRSHARWNWHWHEKRRPASATVNGTERCKNYHRNWRSFWESKPRSEGCSLFRFLPARCLTLPVPTAILSAWLLQAVRNHWWLLLSYKRKDTKVRRREKHVLLWKSGGTGWTREALLDQECQDQHRWGAVDRWREQAAPMRKIHHINLKESESPNCAASSAMQSTRERPYIPPSLCLSLPEAMWEGLECLGNSTSPMFPYDDSSSFSRDGCCSNMGSSLTCPWQSLLHWWTFTDIHIPLSLQLQGLIPVM